MNEASAPHYRAVVVGCGAMGALLEAELDRPKPATHAGAFDAHPGIELVALVDTDTTVLEQASVLFPKADCYSDVVLCFEETKPNIVAIATSSSARIEIIKACVEAKIELIICEKPLALTLSEGKEIEALLKDSGTVFVLNYQRRFFPLFQKVRDEIQAGSIGEILQVTGYYSNGLYTNGSHVLDAASFLLDDTFIQTSGFENKKTSTVLTDPNIDAIFTTSKGSTVTLQSFNQKEYGINELRVFGTRGALMLTEFGFSLERYETAPSVFSRVPQLLREPSTERVLTSSVEGSVAEGLVCLKEKRLPVSSIRNGLEVLAVLDAVTASAKSTGTPQAIIPV